MHDARSKVGETDSIGHRDGFLRDCCHRIATIRRRKGQRCSLTTYVVDSNGDDGDQNIGDHICADHSTPTPHCTLRAAIQEANSTIALDEIDFDITFDAPSTCIYDVPDTPPITAICPTYTLPTISAPLIIDGTTQPGYIPGTPIIQLDGWNGNSIGAGAGVDGLLITGGGSTVKGLWIHGFGRYGIDLRTLGGNVFKPTGSATLKTPMTTSLTIHGCPM